MNLLTKLSCISAGAAFISLGIVSTAQAVTVSLESAPLGSTGQSGGALISSFQFLGWRFQLTDTLQVTYIGGHLGSLSPNNEIFGAIVPLSGSNALPQGNLSQPEEVLAATSFSFSPVFTSNDVIVPLSVTLNPGNYALVFGSGLFGASGAAVMPSNNNPNFPGSSYFFSNVNNGFAWVSGGLSGTRFFVKGEISCR
jgi:hypothetical protein